MRNLLHTISAIAVSAALALAPVVEARAQTVTLPQVTTINRSTDLVPIIPGGQPTANAKYATPALLSSGSSNGVPARAFSMLDFKNSDGTTLAASSAAGKFGLTITAGTSEYLLSEAANSNTKTDTAVIEYLVPANYVAGQNITVTTNSVYTLGSGTVGTHTLAAAAYLVTSAGVQGSTLIATAAQSVPATAGTQSFTITGTTLVPGSRLFLTFVLVIQDTGGSNITARINSVTLS